MIYAQINTASQFRDAFTRAGRNESFSYEGAELLFEYMESSGEDVELDVIALCCDYSESSIEELLNDYEIDIEGLDPEEDTEEVKNIVRAYLEDNTIIIGDTSDGFVYGAF